MWVKIKTLLKNKIKNELHYLMKILKNSKTPDIISSLVEYTSFKHEQLKRL